MRVLRYKQARRRLRGQWGMSLIELTISIGLLAVITVTGFTVIQGATRISEEATARAELNKMGRNAMAIIIKELNNAFISQNQTEHFKTVFKATDRDPTDEIYFVSRAHEKRYANRKEADFAEVGYYSEADWTGGNFRTLVHREARIVDDEPDTGGIIHALCHNVREFNVRYRDGRKGDWVDDWDSESSDHTNKTPKVIEIRLELEDDQGRTASFFNLTGTH